MLRAIEPDESPAPAYRVPWIVHRMTDTHSLVANDSADQLDFVRVFVDGAGIRETRSWGRMSPGEAGEVCLCAAGSDDCIVTMAWFRPDTGEEYVWRFVPA